MHAITEPPVQSRTGPLVAVGVVAAAAYWFAGYLPWLLTGLDGADYLYVVEYDHHAAAPVDLTNLGDLIRYDVIGGVCAGLCTALGGRRHADALLAGLAGLTAALAVVHLQSYLATRDAATANGDGGLVVLIVVSATASCAGWALGALSLRGGARLALLLGIMAATAPAWLMDLSRIATHSVATLVGGPELTLFHSTGAWWVATVPFLAAALITTGARPHRRLAGWPIVLLVSALTTTTFSAIAVTGILLDSEIPYARVVETAREVFWDGLRPDVAGWIAYAAAVAIALAVSYRNVRSPEPDDRPTATTHPHL